MRGIVYLSIPGEIKAAWCMFVRLVIWETKKGKKKTNTTSHIQSVTWIRVFRCLQCMQGKPFEKNYLEFVEKSIAEQYPTYHIPPHPIPRPPRPPILEIISHRCWSEPHRLSGSAPGLQQIRFSRFSENFVLNSAKCTLWIIFLTNTDIHSLFIVLTSLKD